MSTKFNLATTETAYAVIEKLAFAIWQEHYTPIIGTEQVDYMLNKYQSVKAIKEQITDGASYYNIIHDEIAVGYLSVYKKENALFLSKIYILSETRGKGIGKTAMEFIQSKAELMKCTSISLTVNKNNENSIKAYEKMGFQKIKELVMDIGNGFVMDDYLMEKKLKLT
ncbi:MAG: GNAT family N-acetyltransferase [Flavobacteriaceae bacterium]|nr:GNAT family N-acetyltransferase [Flavobacteriaceae bacterium]